MVASERELTPDQPRGLVRRGRLTAFVAAHQLAWDVAFGVLAVAYLGVGIAADSGSAPSDVLLAVLAAIFLAEFFARLWDAPSRYAYVRGHWIDFVSAIPLVGGLRSVRLLRLARLGAVLRILHTAEEEARTHGGGRRSFWYLGPALAMVWFAAAAAYYLLEHDSNPKVGTFGDALYWAFATATTVGYGSGTPATAGGRVLSGALILVGIGLIGVVSAQLVARWLGSDDDAARRRLEARLDQIEGSLEAIRTALARMEAGTSPDGAAQPVAPTPPPPPAGPRRPRRGERERTRTPASAP